MKAAAVMLLGLAAVGCSKGADPNGAESPPPSVADRAGGDDAEPDPDAPAVILRARDGTPVRVRVEVVRTPQALRRGLMYRQHLPVDAGMLFIFPQQEQQSFWMKNTLIPLDMIFIKQNMSILGIVENAEPLTLKSRRVQGDSIYVLEVNGGMTKRWDIDPTAKVEFENVKL